MTSGLDVVFVAMPRADDVGLSGVVLLGADGSIVRDRLDHPLHDAALANRSGAVRTAIVPRKKFSIDPEDADLRLPAVDDLAVALGVVGHFSRRNFRHASLPIRKRAERGSEHAAPARPRQSGSIGRRSQGSPLIDLQPGGSDYLPPFFGLGRDHSTKSLRRGDQGLAAEL